MEKKLKDNDLEKVTGGRIIEIIGRDFVNDGSFTVFSCDTCGMPLAADKGTTSGLCPYCGEITVVDDSNNSGQQFNQNTI